MTDTFSFTADGRIVLTATELTFMQELLDAHDRGGFYMVYNAMTDSAESGLQSRISTFSGTAGGAALAANRLAQFETGGDPTYPIITVTPHLIGLLSQRALLPPWSETCCKHAWKIRHSAFAKPPALQTLSPMGTDA